MAVYRTENRTIGVRPQYMMTFEVGKIGVQTLVMPLR